MSHLLLSLHLTTTPLEASSGSVRTDIAPASVWKSQTSAEILPVSLAQ